MVHRVPPFTVATRWARLSRGVSTATGRATVVGQHVEGLPGCTENHWARLDIALNVAVVSTDEALAKLAVPGPLTMDHVVVSVPPAGWPSSVTVPSSAALAGMRSARAALESAQRQVEAILARGG